MSNQEMADLHKRQQLEGAFRVTLIDGLSSRRPAMFLALTNGG